MSAAEHKALVSAVLKRFGREPDLRLWNNSKVTMVRGVPMAKPGLQTGASDIVGILTMDVLLWNRFIGRHEKDQLARICVFEAKTGKARPTKLQVQFQEMIRRRGGFACVFHSEDEFYDALQRAREGHRR